VPTDNPPLRAPAPLLAFASRVGLILVVLHAYIGWRLLPAWPIGLPGEVAGGLLAHQPRSAMAAAAAGFALQLSGHTHGGQFWPWIHFVRLQQPWTAGLHRLAGLQVYTSRGTGYWGPPKRFGAPAEITRLRLWPSRETRQ